MTVRRQIDVFAAALLFVCQALAQSEPATPPADAAPASTPWAFYFTVDGWVIPNQTGYASPILMADHGWTHLEARYNNEDYHTGSMWLGYNFNAGKTWVLHVNLMIGGVFGRTNGVAPGCEASLTYKKLNLVDHQLFRLQHRQFV
jgi:hypothetical protein